MTRTSQLGSQSLSYQETNTNNGLIEIDQVVVNGAPQTLDCVLTVANLTYVFISTSVDDTTFNPDGAGVTLTLKANTPYVWSTNCGYVNTVWSANTTQVVVTNPDADNDAQIYMQFLYTA